MTHRMYGEEMKMVHDGFSVEDPASDPWSALELQMILLLAAVLLFCICMDTVTKTYYGHLMGFSLKT